MAVDFRLRRRNSAENRLLEHVIVEHNGSYHMLKDYEACVAFWEKDLERKTGLLTRPPVVLLATVPARRAFCEKLLGCLFAQTMRPSVILCGDGYEFTTDMPIGADALEIIYLPTKQAKGAGNRWRWVEDLVRKNVLRPDDIIINIDDDMVASPKAIEQTALALRNAGRGHALGWCGVSSSFHMLANPKPAIYRLLVGCAVAVWAGDIVGISDIEDADLLLGYQGDDELALSVHLRAQGITLFRPAGNSPIFSGPTQHDVVAQHMNKHLEVVHQARFRGYHKLGISLPIEVLRANAGPQ